MEKYQALKCIPAFNCRRCDNCSQNIDGFLECPECKMSYEDLRPIWHFYFTISKVDGGNALSVEGFGPIFDNVMGMSIEDFLYISSKLGDLTECVRRFFEKNIFLMTHSVKRITSISLPFGNQMTFQKWLGIQVFTSPEEVTDMLLSHMNQFTFLPNENYENIGQSFIDSLMNTKEIL